MTELNDYDVSTPEKLTFRKSAKLRHRTLVKDLFDKGKSIYTGPLRVVFRPMSIEELAASFREKIPDRIGPVQLMITVPKKKRRHAVDRVLMRRRIREAFRLNFRKLKHCIEADANIRTLSIAVVYLHSENCDMVQISSAVVESIRKIIKKVNIDND